MSAWYLVYPEKNRDAREILRNLIGYLEDWKLEKTFHVKMKTQIGGVYARKSSYRIGTKFEFQAQKSFKTL